MTSKKHHRHRVYTHKEENFFLPNFCEAQSVFVLSIGAELMALILILATGDILLESWDELGLLSIFVQWIAFASAGILCLTRRLLARLKLAWAAMAAYCMVMLTTSLIAAFAQYFLLAMNYQWSNHPETIGEFVTRCVAINAIVAFLALRYFYVQQQWKQRIQLESQARVEALQARIRPHFLFNSMNIIASLIHIEPERAEQAVEDLSELFRATLRDTGSMVSLCEEWVLCQNYLRIEALRLGERLTLSIDLSHVPQDAGIPMLTLQPLLENAIYHGIQSLPNGGVIKVIGKMQGDIVHIEISNPVPLPSQRPISEGNRMAMINIGHRLDLLFGNHAKLEVDKTPAEYKVTLTFPYLKSGA